MKNKVTISFAGPQASGKTILSNAIHDMLISAGYDVRINTSNDDLYVLNAVKIKQEQR